VVIHELPERYASMGASAMRSRHIAPCEASATSVPPRSLPDPERGRHRETRWRASGSGGYV